MIVFRFGACTVLGGENVFVCREYTLKCLEMLFIGLATSFQMVQEKDFVQFL